MIITGLKTLLTSAGCTLVLYESKQLANIITDQANQNSIVGLILEPETINLEPKGNAVAEHYPPIVVEIMKQARPEDTAENNQATLESLKEIAKVFILKIIDSQNYKKLGIVQATKILENRYDANVIGWSLALDLIPVINQESC